MCVVLMVAAKPEDLEAEFVWDDDVDAWTLHSGTDDGTLTLAFDDLAHAAAWVETLRLALVKAQEDHG